MGKFSPTQKNRIDASKAKAVVDYGVQLGYSSATKDCYWTSYQWCGKFYIGLNATYHVWEADRNDIEDYCEVPTTEYTEMVAQENEANKVDKLASIKYNF